MMFNTMFDAEMMSTKATRILIPVVVVLALLGGIWAICVVNVNGHPPHSIGATRAAMANIVSAAKLFKLDCGAYPTLDQGLAALVTDPGMPNWRGPYMTAIPLDAWGKPFEYSIATEELEIRSSGPDMRMGTEDDMTN